MGCHHIVVAAVDVRPPGVILNLFPKKSALWMPDRKSTSEVGGEGIQVQVSANLAVVTFCCLFEPDEVLLKGLLGLPCGAIDTLQLRIGLVTSPVRARGAEDLEGRELSS